MVSYGSPCMIDKRLKQIKNNEELFGGLNILMFGDLMHLAPIRANAVFDQPASMEPDTHLWREFLFFELTENMRQQGDNVFIDLLNNLRVGKLNSEQFCLLMSKVN